MGFFDTLFGGSEDPTFTQMSTLTPGQRGLLDQLTSLLSGQLGRGVSSYPGTYTAPATENQEMIFNLVNSLLSGEGPMQKKSLGTLETYLEPYSDTKAKDYWTGAVKAPMLESWQKDVIPQVMEQFAAYDAAGSGPAMQAVTESGRRLETDMGSILAKTLQQFEDTYKTRQMDALGKSLNYPQGLINTMLPAATLERSITGEQMQEPYQDWLMEQPWNNPYLKLLSTGLGTKGVENVGYGGGYQQGIFGDLLGAASKLGSAFLLA